MMVVLPKMMTIAPMLLGRGGHGADGGDEPASLTRRHLERFHDPGQDDGVGARQGNHAHRRNARTEAIGG